MQTELSELAFSHPWQFFAGLAVVWFLGSGVDKILAVVKKDFDINRPKIAKLRSWKDVFQIPSERGSSWIGRSERVLFYLSWFLVPEMIAGWLLFKVASKWEVWNNIYKMPAKFERNTVKDSLVARIWLGARTYQRFLLGASLNILDSIIGLIVFTTLVRYL